MENTRLVINATVRPVGKKNSAKHADLAGNVVGVIYAGGKPGIPVLFNRKELETVLRTPYGRNNVFEVTVDGKNYICMAKATEFNPVRREIMHIDLYNVDLEQFIRLNVPVETVGKSAGEKLGGSLQVVSRTVPLRCKVRDVPVTVPHDVAPMGLDETLYVDQLTPPPGCSFVFKHRFPVIRVWAKRGAKTDEPAKA